MKKSTLKRSIRIGMSGEADEVRSIGCNNNPAEEMLSVATLFNGTPACTHANGEQKFSVGIDTGGQLVVYVGKAVEFRRTIIGMMNHNGHQRRKGFVDPTSKAKAAIAAAEACNSVGWDLGDPIPAM